MNPENWIEVTDSLRGTLKFATTSDDLDIITREAAKTSLVGYERAMIDWHGYSPATIRKGLKRRGINLELGSDALLWKELSLRDCKKAFPRRNFTPSESYQRR